MHYTILLAILATFAMAASYTNTAIDPPACPNPNGSLGTQVILLPGMNLGCRKPGGFCKRDDLPTDPFLNGTTIDPPADWANVTERGLVERDQPGGIYICTQKNWQSCMYNVIPAAEMGVCLNFCKGWAQKIHSIGPDAGMTCRIFSMLDCQNAHWDLVKPGNPDTVGSLHTAPQSVVCKLGT